LKRRRGKLKVLVSPLNENLSLIRGGEIAKKTRKMKGAKSLMGEEWKRA